MWLAQPFVAVFSASLSMAFQGATDDRWSLFLGHMLRDEEPHIWSKYQTSEQTPKCPPAARNVRVEGLTTMRGEK